MNDEPSDETLDAMLRHWADESNDPQRIMDLTDRIAASLTEAQAQLPDQSCVTGADTKAGNASWQRVAGVTSTVVAMLLLIVGPLLQPGSDEDAGRAVSEWLPDSVWLRDDQLQEKAALLWAMEETFNGHLLWAAESRERLDFELASGQWSGRSREGERVIVRVIVERRSVGAEEWETAWIRDVLSHEEQFVTASSEEDGSVLRLWTFRLPDGQFAVESELELSGANQLHAHSSGVQKVGRPVQVVDVRGQDAEFRVFQTVAVLDQELI